MNIEENPMLETDRLDDLLEVPAPAQPVVVVEYRNRGVPSWVFFPLIFVVPLAPIVVYHRMVVERYRVQAAQANSLLVREIERERAIQPIVRNDPPPTTVLPGMTTALIGPPPGDPAAPPPADRPDRPIDKAAGATQEGIDLARSSVETPATQVANGGSATPKPSTPTTQPPATASPAPPVVSPQPVVVASGAVAVAPTNPAADPEKPISIKTRTILSNPFAEGADVPRPPAPAAAAMAPTTVVGGTPPVQATNPVAGPVAGGAGSAKAVEKPIAEGVALASVPAARATAPMAPLPTKEETERQIQEEAARRAAEMRAQADLQNVETQAARLAEQLKFRDELAELIRTQGKQAGPEIETLAKRYGYEVDNDKMMTAIRIWRLGRYSQAEKVKKVRMLDLPESVVLGFLFDDIYRTAAGRNGPRNAGEVRVLAAQQLLRYRLVKPTAAKPPAGAASGKTVVSTPR